MIFKFPQVSILYADIVNFTPLAETLTASQLVSTLNQLFGRFDQIAQVKYRERIIFEKKFLAGNQLAL